MYIRTKIVILDHLSTTSFMLICVTFGWFLLASHTRTRRIRLNRYRRLCLAFTWKRLFISQGSAKGKSYEDQEMCPDWRVHRVRFGGNRTDITQMLVSDWVRRMGLFFGFSPNTRKDRDMGPHCSIPQLNCRNDFERWNAAVADLGNFLSHK